jgi:hypothetical protein
MFPTDDFKAMATMQDDLPMFKFEQNLPIKDVVNEEFSYDSRFYRAATEEKRPRDAKAKSETNSKTKKSKNRNKFSENLVIDEALPNTE